MPTDAIRTPPPAPESDTDTCQPAPAEHPEIVEPTHPTLHPALSDTQLECVASLGACRVYKKGETIFRHGQRDAPFVVLKAGGANIFERQACGTRTLIAKVIERRFIGDLAMFTGEPTLAECEAAERCEAYALDRHQLRKLINDHADTGELILKCLMERREWLRGNEIGYIRVIGSRFDPKAYDLRDFLSRNGVMFHFLDLEEQSEQTKRMLGYFDVTPEQTPVLIHSAGVEREPTIDHVANQLGLCPDLDPDEVWDVAVVGGGPGGLGAAVYAASEGLKTLVLEGRSPGGQAGQSSRIENYLGFPTGLSGLELAQRAVLQAKKFGALLVNPRRAVSLHDTKDLKTLTLCDGSKVKARSIVLACGADYRKLPSCPERYDNKGVYYGASHTEAERCEGETAVVIGGGNSAGQAAVNLAKHAACVKLVIRRGGLEATMSDYLIQRVTATKKIELVTHREIEACHGDDKLDAVTLCDSRTKQGCETIDACAVFAMVGADPRTDWLHGCVGLDDKCFVVTGQAAEAHPDFADHWGDTSRRPGHLETTRPGIFAVGDVRHGAINRVAAAIGEGGMAVTFVHRALAAANA
ncbi:MAG: FAD-dependent oxidoreductase [Planctomycetota bacterium]